VTGCSVVNKPKLRQTYDKVTINLRCRKTTFVNRLTTFARRTYDIVTRFLRTSYDMSYDKLTVNKS